MFEKFSYSYLPFSLFCAALGLGSHRSTASELVERIRAGGSGAEEEFFACYRRGINMILGQMLGSREDVEDLSQETFRLALEKIRGGEVREPARLPQFLNSLARNLAIHHFRRSGHRQEEEDLQTVERTLGIEPGQFDQVCRKEKASLALRVLRELQNQRDRELLYRFYIAEDEKDEICRDLSLSRLHFNRVLHRARQRYRDLYEKVVAQS